MLEELQVKIEASHKQLARLSNDIERMRSIEDALIETDQSIAASAKDLKSFVDAAGNTQQSLMDAADSFKDAASALETIDVVKLSETMKKGNDQIRAEILETATKSRDDMEVATKGITYTVTRTFDEVRTEIGRNQESVQQDLTTAEQRITNTVTATSQTILNQVKDATTELDASSKVAPVMWVGVLTLLVSLAVLVVTVLTFLNN